MSFLNHFYSVRSRQPWKLNHHNIGFHHGFIMQMSFEAIFILSCQDKHDNLINPTVEAECKWVKENNVRYFYMLFLNDFHFVMSRQQWKLNHPNSELSLGGLDLIMVSSCIHHLKSLPFCQVKTNLTIKSSTRFACVSRFACVILWACVTQC
jgi:hypothetical protein